MALWNGTTINSTATAFLFNQLYGGGKAINIVRKKNGFLYAVLGKTEPGAAPMSIKFERLNKVTGDKVEFKLLGKLVTVPTVTDYTDEMAATTLENDGNYWGGSVFALAHYAHAFGVPHSELHRIAGKEAKTLSYIDEVMEMLTTSLEAQMASSSSAYGGLHDTKAPARTTFGGWQWAISDGLTDEAAFAAYGTVDRSDAANADYRGIVSRTTGDLDLPKIRTLKNQVVANGGVPKLAIAHTTPYTKVEGLVQQYSVVTYDEKWSMFGGDYLSFSGMTFILDQRAPATIVPLIDPASWVFFQRNVNFTQEGIVNDPSKKASSVLNWGAWLQALCKRPGSNGKLTGITS